MIPLLCLLMVDQAVADFDQFQTDRMRFPPRVMARASMDFNAEYRVNADAIARVKSWEADWWCDCCIEAQHLWHAWDWLEAAQGGQNYNTVQQQMTAFRRLRDIIGEDAYQAGRMPPCVPYWRFEVMYGHRVAEAIPRPRAELGAGR